MSTQIMHDAIANQAIVEAGASRFPSEVRQKAVKAAEKALQDAESVSVVVLARDLGVMPAVQTHPDLTNLAGEIKGLNYQLQKLESQKRVLEVRLARLQTGHRTKVLGAAAEAVGKVTPDALRDRLLRVAKKAVRWVLEENPVESEESESEDEDEFVDEIVDD